MNVVATRLRMIRGDMSQAEAARKLCVARAQYAKYEKGVNAPGVEMVARFCQIFSCSSDWLLGLTDDSWSAFNLDGQAQMSKLFLSRLTDLRGARSVCAFARFLELPQKTVDACIKGERKPSVELVARVCTKCQVTSDWLLGLSEDRNGKSDARVSALEKEVTRLQGMVAGLKFALDHASAPASCG